jgi:hypothetical protein
VFYLVSVIQKVGKAWELGVVGEYILRSMDVEQGGTTAAPKINCRFVGLT